MTEKSNDLSRRDFVAATGATALVGGALAATGTPASAVSSNEICRMDAVTLVQKVRTKQLSASEVTEAVLERMDKLNPALGAFCTPSPEVARTQAKAIDADIMSGKTVGPLAGVPVGIKDLVYTKGIRTTSGSIIYKDFVPTEDDVVVERLKAAGAVIIGKTNVPELGYSGASYNMIFPPTNNPWNTERTAGGSSAGSGAAVAAGIGPMAADGALMMSVIASGADDRDRRTIPNNINWMETIKGDIKGLRVAWTPDWGYAQVDPEVREVCAKAAKVFADQLGCKLEQASPWTDDYFGQFFTIVLTETDLKGLRELVAKYGDQMQPHLVGAIKGTMTDTQITDAVVARKKCANQAWRFFRTYDLLLTPTIACTPFKQGIQGPETIEGKKAGPFQWIAFTYQFNMTGQPAATVPAGFTSDGLPIGLQIVGRHLDDGTVLRAAAAYEAAAPWKDKWPPMLAQMGLE